MLLNIQIQEKKMGTKELFKDLSFTVSEGEKVGLIGRNGAGKTTLFNILSGLDDEYKGAIEGRRGLKLVATSQEHHSVGDITVLEYLLESLPEYATLKKVIEEYPSTMGSDINLITVYSEALDRFGELGYFEIENEVEKTLSTYQLPPDVAHGPLKRLSGGQKRFVELVKVTLAKADLALVDEPTNHMDYVAKAAFCEWLQETKEAVVVITHDRDVLSFVDRIIEIKDKKAFSFAGNYDSYIKQNSVTTVTAMNQYEVAQRTLENLHKQIQSVRAKKASTSKTPNPFIPLERRLMKEYEALKAQLQKPSVWIDQESMADMHDKVVARYDKYKDKNIRIGINDGSTRSHSLINIYDLSLGYTTPLFEPVTFSLRHGERVQLHGRNGVGKTTLIQTVLATVSNVELPAQVYGGYIEYDSKLRLGFYEQEIDPKYLSQSLGDALTLMHRELDVTFSNQRMRQLLSDYLFDPQADVNTPIRNLSGGQKARFQIIKMLAADPNLLILDEPTNHLDLPSIEELEQALVKFSGAILYVSHDSYFQKKLEGEILEVVPV